MMAMAIQNLAATMLLVMDVTAVSFMGWCYWVWMRRASPWRDES
jgi:hypothetical protein